MIIAATEALSRLRRLGKPLVTTAEASMHLGQTRSATTLSTIFSPEIPTP